MKDEHPKTLRYHN